jgi:hypothetical protein
MQTIDQITRAVCDYMKVPYSDVMGRSRAQHIVTPRMIAYHLCRELLDCTLQQIGDYFKRDHGSIIGGVCTVRDRMDVEPTFAALVANIKKSIVDPPPELRPLQWTKLKPEIPGWYFYRPAPGTTRVGLLVKMNNEEAVFDAPGGYGKVRNLEGDWAGPIAEPREEKK